MGKSKPDTAWEAFTSARTNGTPEWYRDDRGRRKDIGGTEERGADYTILCYAMEGVDAHTYPARFHENLYHRAKERREFRVVY